MRALGATALAGALLLTAAPASSADQVRDAQWANQYFNLDKVWSITKGEGVIVAVIDSGVDGTHPDLTGQVLPGYDPSGKGLGEHPTDPHGTGMASNIAGHGHGNNEGMVGLAPGVKILPLYKDTAAETDAVPEDIKWAVDHGAKVINLSLGADAEASRLPDAIAYAYQHDVLVVASSGNSAAPVEYPGKEPGVLAVGAVDKSLKIWADSNYGPEVMLSAPGTDIVAAGSCGTSRYCKGTGTSNSTAYVSAAAALVRAKFPKLTAGQVANRLAKSALVPSSLSGAKLPDQHYGYGIIRPYEALTQDIPAGPPQGPLAMPTEISSGSAAGEGTSAQPGGRAPTAGGGPDIRKPASKTPLILGGVGVAVVVLVVIIAIAVGGSRRRNRAQAATGQPGPAPYAGAPGWPPIQQSPHGQQSQPSGYPYQQPPYGQPPQSGYPQQPPPPYQPPYQQR